MLDNPTSLSEMLKSIVTGYDEIKYLSEQNTLINNNISSIKTAFESELQTSKAYNERTKLNLDDINEKLANAKNFYDEIASNQAEVKALFTSINNLVIKEAALIKNVDSKIISYTELNAKNTELLAEINTIKEAVILATKTYKNDCDLALKELNESLARANTLNESLASKQIELNNTLESIEAARTSCLQISNEIKEMRKRSQCLMSKAEEIFNKAIWFENTLNEYIAKITELENNYNLALVKNEELELKIKDSIATLDKILIALNGRSLDEVLTELKTTNTTLQTAINTKAEIDKIKANLEAILAEQKTKLDNYYTKLQCDELLSLVNDEITKLQTNKADITELEPIKTDIVNLANTKANASDVYTKLQSDELLSLVNDEITKLQTNKADITELEPIKTDIVNLANTKANIGDLEPIKTDITNLSNDKANKIDVYHKSDVYTKLESDNLLKTKANTGDLAKAKSDLEVRIKAVEDDRMKVYTTPLTCSVGVGGEFKTLAEAFKALSYFKKASPSVGNCVITMLPNFVLKEFLHFENCDLSHITLTSSNNCIISCDFANPISENRNVFSFHNANSCFFYKAHFNFINQPQRLIIAGNNADIRFAECSVKNATYGLLAYDSNLNVKSSTFTNTKEACLYATEKSSVNSISNTFDTSSRGIYSMRNTTTNSYRDIFKNITNECFYIDWGGFAMYEAHPNGSFVNSPKKCNLVPNTLYKHGIFFDRTTPEEPIIQTNIPNGKMFKCNGINVIVIRNLKVVPTVTSNTVKTNLTGSVTFTYTITLPIGGVFLVGMNYKGVFMSGQKLEDKKEISGWTNVSGYLSKGVGFQVPAEERTYNIVAIGY